MNPYKLKILYQPWGLKSDLRLILRQQFPTILTCRGPHFISFSFLIYTLWGKDDDDETLLRCLKKSPSLG